MKWFLEALFPRYCLSCQAEGKLLCAACRSAWWLDPPKPTDEHLSFYAYANPLARQLITTWKYGYDHSAWLILQEHARPLLEALRARVKAKDISAIVPLPLSPRRERERGFNQSELIAGWLSAELKLPVIKMLTRVHRLGHQADRSETERKIAMVDSPFRATAYCQLPTPAVLLVDDVWTTGSTMEAAKKTLNSFGIAQVLAFTLAKG